MKNRFDCRGFVFRGTANVSLLCPHEPVNAYLTAGDTIRVCGFDGDEWAESLSPFVGRIVDVP